MSTITTIDQLKDYCLRKLGEPVIKVNVSLDQVYDRLYDAFDFFNEFHYDSSARIFHKHQITQTDIDNEYITIPNEITHIKKVLPLSSGTGSTNNSDAIFDPIYQMRKNDFLAFGHTGTSLQYFYQMKERLRMLEIQLSGAQQEIDFERYNHQLKIRVDWEKDITLGEWIIIEADRLLLDPDDDYSEVSDVYNDQLLKEYSTALIKEQWGTNLSKFEGIQMPGGVTYSGERILNEARDDIQRIKEEAKLVWQNPLGLYVG